MWNRAPDTTEEGKCILHKARVELMCGNCYLPIDLPFTLRVRDSVFTIDVSCSIRIVPQLRVEESVEVCSLSIRCGGCHDVYRKISLVNEKAKSRRLTNVTTSISRNFSPVSVFAQVALHVSGLNNDQSPCHVHCPMCQLT
jgi:hypothetical protein